MRDLSPYFIASEVARRSMASDQARLRGALFSVYALIVDSLRIPQFVNWLERKLKEADK